VRLKAKTYLLFFWFCGVSLSAFGQSDNTPKYANEFLQLGVGARSFALALSSVAYVDDATSGYWNPAGLRRLERNQGMLMHASYFGGLANYDYGAYATRLDEKGHIGVSLIRFAVDDIPDTRFLFDANGAINYDNIRFFSAADYALIGSYARSMDWLGGVDMGASVKIIHRRVGDFSSSWGFGFDLGLQKQINQWQFGAVLRDAVGTFNAWSHNTEELEAAFAVTDNALPESSLEIVLPRAILGVSRSFRLHEAFSLMTTLDLDFTFDGRRNTPIQTDLLSIDPHGGLELGFKEQIFLRAGVGQFQRTEDFDGNTSWVMQPSAGLGFQLNQITIDYALTDAFNQAEGLYSHIFSVKIDFDEEK
jgi:hypothetical protein